MIYNTDNLVLLDRDGVINMDSDAYIKSPEEWQAIPGSLDGIARLNRAGFHVVVITNQSGVGRHYFSEATLANIHTKMIRELEKFHGAVLDIFFCPHTPDAHCSCRKPKPGLLEQLKEKYPVELQGVPFIGDSRKDLELAHSQGCQPILVKTGKGLDYFHGQFSQDPWHKNTLVFDTLASVCDFLVTRNERF